MHARITTLLMVEVKLVRRSATAQLEMQPCYQAMQLVENSKRGTDDLAQCVSPLHSIAIIAGNHSLGSRKYPTLAQLVWSFSKVRGYSGRVLHVPDTPAMPSYSTE